ncbi:NAD(P)/FAD-dependent oxidoreductase [Oscillospiraceae bacterium HV4-5-C5C]|nr:NAD(P)/FAD-dependent oxidoreductase [Oscillospiraceae bacterium HV4-5-C5C]
MKHYDLILIGSGAGNIVLDAGLEQGLHCALIEKGKFGGTCLNRGCLPSKVLVTAANLLRDIKKAEAIGVHTEQARLDWPAVSRRVWQKIDENQEIRAEYHAEPNLDVYEGSASFTGPGQLEVKLNEGGERQLLTADKIVIATGGRSRTDALPGLRDGDYITSESFFGSRYPTEPWKRVAILGGGPIGTEFAHVLSSAGSEVHLIQRNVRLLPHEDPEISQILLESMTGLGIDVRLNTVISQVEHPAKQDPSAARLRLQLRPNKAGSAQAGDLTSIEADILLIAAGIVPHADLHPELAGISLDERGWIRTNELLETSVPGIYALGDCNGGAQFRHKANYEAEILAHNLFGGQDGKAASWQDRRWARYDLIPYVTYAYPEVAHIGRTEAELVRNRQPYRVGYHHYYQTGKGYALGYEETAGQGDGLVKLLTDPDGMFLGVHIIGHEAALLLQPFVDLMYAGPQPFEPQHPDLGSADTKAWRAAGPERQLPPASLQLLDESIVPHPTLNEAAAWVSAYMSEVKQPG